MTSNENPSSQLLIRVPPELKAALNKMAVEEHTTVSNICRDALTERVEWYNDLDDL